MLIIINFPVRPKGTKKKIEASETFGSMLCDVTSLPLRLVFILYIYIYIYIHTHTHIHIYIYFLLHLSPTPNRHAYCTKFCRKFAFSILIYSVKNIKEKNCVGFPVCTYTMHICIYYAIYYTQCQVYSIKYGTLRELFKFKISYF